MPRDGRGLFTACSFAFVSKVCSLFQCKPLIFSNHQLKGLVFNETMFANTFIIWDNPKGRKGDGACNCSLRAGGGMLFTEQGVRKEAQKSRGWDLLTDGTGSDSRAWDQLQPAMALFSPVSLGNLHNHLGCTMVCHLPLLARSFWCFKHPQCS